MGGASTVGTKVLINAQDVMFRNLKTKRGGLATQESTFEIDPRDDNDFEDDVPKSNEGGEKEEEMPKGDLYAKEPECIQFRDVFKFFQFMVDHANVNLDSYADKFGGSEAEGEGDKAKPGKLSFENLIQIIETVLETKLSEADGKIVEEYLIKFKDNIKDEGLSLDQLKQLMNLEFGRVYDAKAAQQFFKILIDHLMDVDSILKVFEEKNQIKELELSEKVKVISTLNFKKYLLSLRESKDVDDQPLHTNLQTWEIDNFTRYMEIDDEGYILVSSLHQMEQGNYVPSIPKDKSEVFWYRTMDDDYVAFKWAQSASNLELDYKKLLKMDKFKKLEDFKDSFAKKSLKEDSLKFEDGQRVYHATEKAYYEIVCKFEKEENQENEENQAEDKKENKEPEELQYKCKLVDQEEDTEIVLPAKDLTSFIDVSLQLIEVKENNRDKNVEQELRLKVNVKDKVSKLLECANKMTGNEYSSYMLAMNNEERIENAGETFGFHKVTNGQVFQLIAYLEPSGGNKSLMIWRRFLSKELTSYQTLYRDNDAMQFIPKRDVTFYGFGMLANYHEHDMKLIVRWRFGPDGEDFISEWMHFELKHADIDRENMWHTVDIRDWGFEPVRLTEGLHFHLMVQRDQDDSVYVNYGYDGEPYQYNSIDQPQDFYTASSRFTDNGTRDNWGCFPFILYSY